MSRTPEARNQSSLNDSAYEKIREMILRGSLAPGGRIVEAELAEMFSGIPEDNKPGQEPQ